MWTRRRLRRRLSYEGRLKVIESNGQWGVYEGERIVLGEGMSFHDDLGVKIREAFQPGAAEALERGDALGESFELPRVRIEIKRLR
jgi:hypothetical protein